MQAEWQYVNGVAVPRYSRDRGHEGMTPEDFQREINAWITERRKAMNDLEGSESKRHLLSLEEVLAIRLISGPVHKPVNDFLRQLATMSGEQQLIYQKYGLLPTALNFAITVETATCALNKIAAVTEQTSELLRGVPGILPERFWAQDLLVATEPAFLSTSGRYATAMRYLADGKHNVVWKLSQKTTTNAPLRLGADLSKISQYGDEDELMFPPGTTMVCRADGLTNCTPRCADERKRSLLGHHAYAYDTHGRMDVVAVPPAPRQEGKLRAKSFMIQLQVCNLATWVDFLDAYVHSIGLDVVPALRLLVPLVSVQAHVHTDKDVALTSLTADPRFIPNPEEHLLAKAAALALDGREEDEHEDEQTVALSARKMLDNVAKVFVSAPAPPEPEYDAGGGGYGAPSSPRPVRRVPSPRAPSPRAAPAARVAQPTVVAVIEDERGGGS